MFITDLEEKIYQGGQISKEEALLHYPYNG